VDDSDAPGPEVVLDFWFGSAAASDPVGTADARQALWWGGDPATDRLIASRFGGLHRLALAGAVSAWTTTPRGRLAAILVVDQFSRVLHRGTAAAFAGDPIALGLCREGLARGDDQALAPLERVFFYLPLEHAESGADQDRSVALYEALAREVPPEARATFESFAGFARRHRDVVARFGRFPHRNKALQRPSTPEEVAFLAQPGSSF
jgi:uncharacterized protein (DUF924 family)